MIEEFREEAVISKPRLNKKIGAAKERWKILAQILHEGKKTREISKSCVSVRRVESFGLFDVRLCSQEEKCQWYQYTISSLDTFSLHVREMCDSISAEKLLGFNNTGNICIWPAEEIMAYYCLKHPHYFRTKSVLELGGGMSGLAGFSVAIGTEAETVVVTDGNEDSVKNLEMMVEQNEGKYGQTNVEACLLRWGPEIVSSDQHQQYDVILCSDCLFFEEGRNDLINCIHHLLKPQGEVIIFAPRRGETFHTFINLAQNKFSTQVDVNYDPKIWKLHSQFKEDQLYDENIHYPILLKMTKKQL